MKRIFALAAPLMLIFLTACGGIKSKGKFYSPKEIESDKTVFISIDCSEILDNFEKLDEGLGKYVPEYGLVIPDGEYPIEKGDTVYDVLVRVVRKNKIHMESRGGIGGKEIEGISYIYNSSCGNGSRWIYKVNGKVQQSVCSECKVENGDVIQWLYVCGDK